MSHGDAYLVVENLGKTAARDLRVKFNPPLPNYETTPDGQTAVVASFLKKRYENPIVMLAPNQRLKNLYSYIGSAGVNMEKMPKVVEMTVAYKGERGVIYNDKFPLDVGIYNNETQSNPGRDNDPEKRKNQALEAIAWELWD